MSYLIAVSGKGGVGKTTLSGLIVASLIQKRLTPVLALDADPNICLDTGLGVTVKNTVGGVREQVRKTVSQEQSGGISKQQLLEMKIAESVVESTDFDLIAMGRPEGPGCYCYANNILKSVLANLAAQYPFVVLDNEAGLENLSRRIVQKVNLLIIVTDPSQAGITTVRRIHALAAEMGIVYDRLAIVVNRLRHDQLPAVAESLATELKADTLLGLPDDATLAENAETGKPVFALPIDHPLRHAVDILIAGIVPYCPG
jgi:CO dehydrogenase maturation factor